MAPIGNTTPVHVGMIDHSGELTGVQLYFPPVEDDGSNVDDLFAPTTGAYDVVKGPLILLTQCNLTRSIGSIIVDESTPSLPASTGAQRELAARFTYVDEVTGKKYSFSVPGPATTIIPSGTDEISLANAFVSAFITVFEAQCVSPDGNAVEVTGARLVGRNS